MASLTVSSCHDSRMRRYKVVASSRPVAPLVQRSSLPLASPLLTALDTDSAPHTPIQAGWKIDRNSVGLSPHGLVCNELPIYNGPPEIPAGSVIRGNRFIGNISLYQGSILIEKSCFQPISAGRGMPIVTTTNFSGNVEPGRGRVILRDNEFDGTLLSDEIAAWATGFWGIADLQRNYIHHFGGGIALYNTGSEFDALIENNYVTDMLGWGDPRTTGNHSDAFTIRDFTDHERPTRLAVVRNNHFHNESPNVTGSLFIQANSRIANVLIEGNLLTGGGFNLALEQNRGGYSNMKAINNRFVPTGYGHSYITGGEGWRVWKDNHLFDPTKTDVKGAAK